VTTTAAVTTTIDLPSAQERKVDVSGSPIVLRFDSSVPNETLDRITAQLISARDVQGDSGPLTVHIYFNSDDFASAYSNVHGLSQDQTRSRLLSGGVRATVHLGHIWLTPALAQPGPPLAVTIYHEYFHTVQKRLANKDLLISNDVPYWLLEGPANYFGYTHADADGVSGLTSFRQAVIRTARSSARLSALERIGPGPSAQQGNELGFIATEYLIRTFGEQKVKLDYWSAFARGMDWRAAFVTTFGVPVDQFYADFESYQLTL
jgi:hypothetical protein